MTALDLVKMTGQVPNKFTTAEGKNFELFIRKRTNSKGYLATIYEMVNDHPETILYYGNGKTIEDAKADLLTKILNLPLCHKKKKQLKMY